MLSPELKNTIESDIKNNKVMIYMKGTPDQPMCGFSARVIQIMGMLGAKVAAKNVLADESLRQGIKEFSNWPTIPQIYVNGEFIGGCDIVTEMYETGELEKLINS